MISSGSLILPPIVRQGYSPAAWNTYPYALDLRAASGLTPLTVMVPPVGCSRSAMQRKKVVLPQPDGPMKLTKSPFSMFRLTPFSACTGPSFVSKVSDRFCALITVFVVTLRSSLASAPLRRAGPVLSMGRACGKQARPGFLKRLPEYSSDHV